tara:strand:- start:5993 stop:6925 length:933 start_codon:yes stop_codon:yes gene_type:complete
MNNPSIPKNTDTFLKSSHFRFKYLSTWLGILCLFLISKMPMRFTFKLGKILGLLLYKVAKRRRKIAEQNIKLCFPEKKSEEINFLVKENFINFGIGIFEMALGWWASDKRIKNIQTSFVNKKEIEDLEKNKEGVLVLIKHSTHLELDLRLLSRDLSLGGMYRPQNNLVINHFMIKARNSIFTGVVNRSETKKAIRWIKEGLKFLYAADQDYGEQVSEFISFFGHKAATVKLPAYFAAQNIRTVFLNVDRKDLSYQIELIELNTGLRSDDFLKSMNNEYEKVINNFPEQYLWVHRRFKSSKELGKEFYPSK